MLCVSGGAFAQNWAFGPKVGANFSTVNGLESVKTRTGVTAGLFAERAMCNWFNIQTELMWSQQGFRQEGDGVTIESHLNYINMPVLGKIYITGGLNLQVGAQFGYLVTAKETGDMTYGLKGAVNKFNTDILVGMAYDFDCGLILEGRYNIGLNNLQTTVTEQGLRNGTLQFMVGWAF